MKRLLTIISSFILVLGVSAQERSDDRLYRHEVAIGTGYTSFASIVYSHWWGTWGEGLEARHPFPAPVSVHYFYRLNGKWALGATAHYEQYGRREFYYGLMPQAKWSWLNREKVSLYSRVGVGLMYAYYINYDNRFVVDFQLSPVGIEVGKKHWRGYLEAGVGMQDFVQGGVLYRF